MYCSLLTEEGKDMERTFLSGCVFLIGFLSLGSALLAYLYNRAVKESEKVRGDSFKIIGFVCGSIILSLLTIYFRSRM